MSSFDYIIMPFQGLLNHGARSPRFAQDIADTNPELDVHARSGEYLATVATNLDELSQRLPEVSEAEVAVIQKLINDLLYVQRHYKLVRK